MFEINAGKGKSTPTKAVPARNSRNSISEKKKEEESMEVMAEIDEEDSIKDTVVAKEESIVKEDLTLKDELQPEELDYEEVDQVGEIEKEVNLYCNDSRVVLLKIVFIIYFQG